MKSVAAILFVIGKFAVGCDLGEAAGGFAFGATGSIATRVPDREPLERRKRRLDRREFEVIDPPRRLVYTWRLGDGSGIERVTVRFISQNDATEVVVCHERVASEASRDAHQMGWNGCLNGLAAFAEQ